MRDLTLESLPTEEWATANYFAERFADSFQHYEPTMSRDEALGQARELETVIWIKMGPQSKG